MKTHRFEFPRSAVTGYQLELLIRQYGIPVYNRHVGKTLIEFDVPVQQAKWATYIFQRAGVLLTGDAASVDAQYGPRPLPTAWGTGVKRRDLMTLWIDFLGTILGAPMNRSWQAKRRDR